MYARKEVRSTQDLRAVLDGLGSHVFAEETVHLFQTRLKKVEAVDGPETKRGNRFVFLTSEKDLNLPRFYVLNVLTLGLDRTGNPGHRIEEVVEFDNYCEAKKFMKKYVQNLKEKM